MSFGWMDDGPKQNIEIFTKYELDFICFNESPFILSYERSHSHVIWEVGHTIQCSNFSELETPDDGRVRPQHVVRRKRTVISSIVHGDIFYKINEIFVGLPLCLLLENHIQNYRHVITLGPRHESNKRQIFYLVLSLSLSFLLLQIWSIRDMLCFHYSFLILRQLVGLLGRGIGPVATLLPTTNRMNADLNAIQTHDPSIIGTEWNSFLRPRGHCDQLFGATCYNVVILYCSVSRCRKTAHEGCCVCFITQFSLTFLVRRMKSWFRRSLKSCGSRVSVVGWGTMLQAGRSLVLFPMRSLIF
jgi:hypothetical protein